MQENKFLDTVLFVLFLVLATLWVSGGVSYQTSTFKLELSQLDVFACMFLLLILLRRKLHGDFFPKFFTDLTQKILDGLETHPKKTLCMAFFGTVFFRTWLQTWRYDSFHANAYDLSYLDQPIWATNHIGFLYSSLSVNNTYLGEHFSPILGIVSLFYKLFESTYTLFFLQSFILSGAVVLIYKIARAHKLSKGISSFLALCYLLYQPVRSANIFDFREDNLFIAIFLSAYYFAFTKRFLQFYLFILCAWCTKENAAIFTFLIGLWMLSWPKKSDRIQGIATAILSLAVFYVVNQKITPMFSGSEEKTRFAFRLGGVANSAGGFVVFAFTHPIEFLSFIFKSFAQKSVLKYFLIVFAPFLVAFRGARLPFAIAFIGFCLNVILGITSVGFHYECIFAAFLFIALVVSVSKNKNLQTPTALLFITLSFLLFYGRSSMYSIQKFKPTAHDKVLDRELRKIPSDASVATQSSLHPHVSHRRDALLFSGAPITDYVVIDLDERYDRYGTPNLLADASLISPAQYELVVSEASLRIWKKKNE